MCGLERDLRKLSVSMSEPGQVRKKIRDPLSEGDESCSTAIFQGSLKNWFKLVPQGAEV